MKTSTILFDSIISLAHCIFDRRNKKKIKWLVSYKQFSRLKNSVNIVFLRLSYFCVKMTSGEKGYESTNN